MLLGSVVCWLGIVAGTESVSIAIYAATRQFAQLLRDKNAAETAGILEVAKSAARHLRHK